MHDSLVHPSSMLIAAHETLGDQHALGLAAQHPHRAQLQLVGVVHHPDGTALRLDPLRALEDPGDQSPAHVPIPTVSEEEKSKEAFVSASEIRVHPTGKFIYAANRGHDTITAFRIDQDTGQLSVIEREHVRGATPRNFNLDPSGRWLLAAGQDSHTLASFEVNQETGELTYNRSNVFAPSAICVLFAHE